MFTWKLQQTGAFVCLGFLVNNLSYIPTETSFEPVFPCESKLLLRSELPVVTLGKSLPGNCSKLGHLFAWAFLSIIFLTYQLKLIYIFFHVRVNYYCPYETSRSAYSLLQICYRCAGRSADNGQIICRMSAERL